MATGAAGHFSNGHLWLLLSQCNQARRFRLQERVNIWLKSLSLREHQETGFCSVHSRSLHKGVPWLRLSGCLGEVKTWRLLMSLYMSIVPPMTLPSRGPGGWGRVRIPVAGKAHPQVWIEGKQALFTCGCPPGVTWVIRRWDTGSSNQLYSPL